MSEIQQTEEKKKAGRKPKSDLDNLGDVQILEYPNRTIPKLLEDALEKGLTVILAKDGYYISGFYGLNPGILGGGFVFAQDTTEANALAVTDAKGVKHLVKSFSDLVFFNSSIWGYFFKQSDTFKKPDAQWFPYMLEYGALNISPK